MLDRKKNIPGLRAVTMPERATSQKARESWHLWGIISEFVESAERLSEIRPAVSIFGSARIRPGSPVYAQAEQIARKLSDAGFAVISGGGPGIMEAANRGAFAGSTATPTRMSRCAFATFSRARWPSSSTPPPTWSCRAASARWTSCPRRSR
jgi:hypothetical protein